MFQTIDGIDCFVVDIKEPPLTLLPIVNDGGPSLQLYVDALNTAITQGVVTEPGMYGINVTDSGKMYNVFKIIDKT